MDRPSATKVFFESWPGARRVLASRPRFYWLWLAAAAVVGAASLLVPDSIMQTASSPDPVPAPAVVALVCAGMMVGVLAYFVLADAVRTFVPAFQMTVPVFFLALVANMGTSMGIQIAMYCFIVPAFYVGPKLWLWLPNYLLTTTEYGETAALGSSLTRAWLDTNNLYWPTLGLIVLILGSSILAAVVGLMLPFGMIVLFRPLAVVAAPLMVGALIYLTAQVDCAWLSWAVAVRRHADALVTPAIASEPA